MNTCIHTYIHTHTYYTYLPTYLTYKHTYTYAYVFVLRRPTCSASQFQLGGDPNGSFVEGSLSLAVNFRIQASNRFRCPVWRKTNKVATSPLSVPGRCVCFLCAIFLAVHLSISPANMQRERERERKRLAYTGKAIRAKSHHKAKQEGEPVIGVVSWQALLDRLVSSRTN